MRVDGEQHLRRLGAALAAPRLGPAEEQALRGRVAVDLLAVRVASGQQPGVVGDAEAAQVADVLADGQLPVDRAVDALGRQAVELGDQPLGQRLEGLAVRGLPPVAEAAVAVAGGSLVVEAVADLVPDHRADGAVVDRVVGLGVEERRLQDGRGEHDLVAQRVVVRVDRLGVHLPLVLVDGLADAAERPVELERVGREHVGHQVVGGEAQRGVVAPARRVADLRRELRQFAQRLRAGLLRHPGELLDGVAVRLEQPGDEAVHRLLLLRLEVPGDVRPADGLAQRALDQRDAPLPPRALLLVARQRPLVEVEPRVDERAGQVAGQAGDRLPSRPAAPGLERQLGQQRGRTLDERRLRHDQLPQGLPVDARAGEVRVPVEAGGGGDDVGERHRVVHRAQIAQPHPVPVVRGDPRLDVEHGLRLSLRVLEPSEREHPREVGTVLLADLRVLIEAVVGLVGQAEAALVEERGVARRVAGVGLLREVDKRAQPVPQRPAEVPGQRAGGVDGVDGREDRGQRSGAQLLDAVGVHERAVQRGDAPLVGVEFTLALLDQLADVALRGVVQIHEAARRRLVRLDPRRAQPGAVHEAEQVVLGTERAVGVCELDGGSHARQCRAPAGPAARARPG